MSSLKAITSGLVCKERVISFSNLAVASSCLSFVEYDDGLIAHGLKSVLIPMSQLEDDDAIQWHFESKAPPGSKRLLSIGAILKSLAISDWYRESDPARLVPRRCFLGWVDEAEIAMGTSTYNLQVQPSRASDCDSVDHIKHFELATSVSFFSWVGIQGNFVRERVSVPTSFSTSQHGDLLDILNLSTDQHGIIFEHETRNGWAIPRANIVLQIANHLVKTGQYELYEGDELVSRQDERLFARGGSSEHSSGLAALKRCLGLKIRKPMGGPGQFKEEGFSDLATRIWQTLSDAVEGLDSAAKKLQLTRGSANKILGVDFWDIIHINRPITVRCIQVDQPWVHLTKAQPLVLTCRIIAPPIVPISNTCESHISVPCQQNLLVATASTVKSYLEYQSYGLAQGLDWIASSNLIETHEKAGISPISHIQKLKLTRKPVSNSRLYSAIQACLPGAFIFGNGSEKKCHGPHSHSSVDKVKQDDKPSLASNISSISSISTSASATSAEGAGGVHLRSVSPRSQHNSMSEESNLGEERGSLSSSPESSAQEFEGHTPIIQLEQISGGLGENVLATGPREVRPAGRESAYGRHRTAISLRFKKACKNGKGKEPVRNIAK